MIRNLDRLRKVLFWVHLVAGVAAGLVIALMSLTGVAIAFEAQVLEWAERDARHVQAPAPDAARLSVDELVARVRAARPEAQPSGVTVYPGPDAAVLVSLGREGLAYVNPYTGEVREGGARGWRSFFGFMENLHRWLAAQGDGRAVGRAITGAGNAAFLFLAVSGLYLWWPRKWTRRAMRPSLWFRRGLKGKARDWNWHNVIGFWSLPVLIVLTASGMVISYKWASDLVFTVTGNPPPATQGPPGQSAVKLPTPPPPGTERLGLDALFAEASKGTPAWKSVSLRLGGGQRPGEPQGARASPAPEALTFTVREQGAWPLFASTQVSLNPFTGEQVKQEGYADYNSGRKLRTWLRFLHTGEALGWLGQLAAAVASLGGVFLVWTGFALAWRRFFPRRHAAPRPSARAEPGTTA
ncbi:PepSY domain-containing protein [Myxococcus sp. RHST-1-4]|nr:PepSY domain-containing protein [Myxococcus sp. RHSTA-1-4]